MQRIDRILKIDGGIGSWSDEWGGDGDVPEIMIGVRTQLVIDLRSSIKDSSEDKLLPFEFDFEYDSCYFVLDADYDKATIPRMHKTNGITITSNGEKTQLIAELPYTATPELMAALATNQGITLNGEIALYKVDDGVACVDFAVQFTLSIRNRIFLGGEVPEDVVDDPMYLTASEVKALIAEATRPDAGKSAYDVALDNGFEGTVAQWLTSLIGEQGDSAYKVAVAGGYEGTVTQWLASLKGEAGKSAYEIAVAGGYNGTEAQWINSLKGETGKNAFELAVAAGYPGNVTDWLESLKGKPGQDFRFDATGSVLADLDLYANTSAGFSFGCSVTNATTKITKVYIYVKRSDALNDWFDPCVITYYTADTAVLLEPWEFSVKTKDDNDTYYYLPMPNNCAHIASVCIDTDEGEYLLPYNSSNGITKIIKDSKDNFRLYFGTNVPEFTKGRVYFSQGWASASIAVEEIGNMYYGYVSGVSDLSNLSNLSSLTATECAPLTKRSIGTGTRGQMLVVAIPSGSSLTATKFDGIASAVAFEESVSGANGDLVTIGDVEYKVYGEFIITTGERFIYVN